MGQKRHLDVAGQKLPRDTFCLSIVSQLTLTAGVILKEEECPLLWVRHSFGGILGDNLGEGNCESKIVARQWETIFAARHQGVSQGPLGNVQKAPSLELSLTFSLLLGEEFRHRGGGQNAPDARGGGELAPKVAPRRLGLLTPKLAILYRISVEKGRIQGPLKIQNLPPPPSHL